MRLVWPIFLAPEFKPVIGDLGSIDDDETKAVVKRWVDFYKQHRAILDSDIIHLRRADARDWDGWLHVNPQLSERGLAFFIILCPRLSNVRFASRFTTRA